MGDMQTVGFDFTETEDEFRGCAKEYSTESWLDVSAMASTVPVLIAQITVALFLNHLLQVLLKPLKQPPVVSHFLTGVIMGPSALSRARFAQLYITSFSNVQVLETFSNLGVVYYLFLTGFEIDLRPITNGGKKALAIALSGISIPFVLGFLVHYYFEEHVDISRSVYIFWGIALTASNFPDIADVLMDLKMLQSDLGRLALGASSVCDISSLVLILFVTTGHFHGGRFDWRPISSSIVFIVLSVLLVRPLLKSAANHALKDIDNFSKSHIIYILALVLLFGLSTSVLGSHAIVGAFILGVIMPREERIRRIIFESIETFVCGIMMPLYFLAAGLRTDVGIMTWSKTGIKWYMILAVSVLSLASKVVSTLLVTLYCKMPVKEGITLGMLMNTKGALALILINVGRDLKYFDNRTYPLMILVLLLMGSLVEPVISAINQPKNRSEYCRTIRSAIADRNAHFRILTCSKSVHDVSSTINFLGALTAFMNNPISVVAVHLVEVTGRVTAMMMVHDQYKTSHSKNIGGMDEIANAFQNFMNEKDHVSVERITLASHYETMHEDVCNLASDKNVAFIIVPFRIENNNDSEMEQKTSTTLAHMNRHILANAPCSVGLLVDRGATRGNLADNSKPLRVAVLFIGGPDDREVLACALRMTGQSSVTLTLIRFLPGKTGADSQTKQERTEDQQEENCRVFSYNDRQRNLDDDCIYEFLFNAGDSSVDCIDKFVNDGSEVLDAIQEQEQEASFDLYIMGRGQSIKSPVTAGLADWDTFPDLGLLGDTLTSATFIDHASLLVVQAYSSTKKTARTGSLTYGMSSTWPLANAD